MQAIGSALPAAVAIALSPFPVIGIVLILAGPDGRRTGPLFAVGWLVGLSAVAVFVVVVFGAADDPDSTSRAIVDWFRVAAGAGLIAWGVRKWWTRPSGGEAPATPAWTASLGEATPGRALGLGALLGGANPKNFVLTAAAASSMVEAGAHGTDLVVAVVVFVVLASSTVLGAVVVRRAGGPRGASSLEAVRGFMVANATVVTVVIVLVIGAKVLGDGLAGLGR